MTPDWELMSERAITTVILCLTGLQVQVDMLQTLKFRGSCRPRGHTNCLSPRSSDHKLGRQLCRYVCTDQHLCLLVDQSSQLDYSRRAVLRPALQNSHNVFNMYCRRDQQLFVAESTGPDQQP
jgi:hypothetical protein